MVCRRDFNIKVCVHIGKIDRMSNIAATTVIEKHPMQIDRMSNIAATTVIEKHPMQIDRMSNIATTTVIEKEKCTLTCYKVEILT